MISTGVSSGWIAGTWNPTGHFSRWQYRRPAQPLAGIRFHQDHKPASDVDSFPQPRISSSLIRDRQALANSRIFESLDVTIDEQQVGRALRST